MKAFLMFILCLAMSSAQLQAQKKGTLSRNNILVQDCSYNFTVAYSLWHLMGEPTVNATYKISGDANCKLPHTTLVWLKIEHPTNGMFGFIKVDPVVPKVNGDYGYTSTGSPNWDEYICSVVKNKKGECYSKEEAILLYKEGEVTSFEVGW